MDYNWYGILLVIIFYLFRDNKLLMSASFSATLCLYCIVKNSTFALPEIFALIPILCYNNKKGPSAKYLFYIYYPLHLVVLSILYYKIGTI